MSAAKKKPRRRAKAHAVHNHGLDPSCRETVINGRRVGACLIEEAELSGAAEVLREHRISKGEVE